MESSAREEIEVSDAPHAPNVDSPYNLAMWGLKERAEIFAFELASRLSFHVEGTTDENSEPTFSRCCFFGSIVGWLQPDRSPRTWELMLTALGLAFYVANTAWPACGRMTTRHRSSPRCPRRCMMSMVAAHTGPPLPSQARSRQRNVEAALEAFGPGAVHDRRANDGAPGGYAPAGPHRQRTARRGRSALPVRRPIDRHWHGTHLIAARGAGG
jgi:hypothetical protein